MTHDARTVLYIEDDASNRRLVERVLQRRPHLQLLLAKTGLSGLEMAGQNPPAVVLLDLALPDIDGEEVLRRLRVEPSTSSIPVIVISADANQRTIQRLLESGAEAFLTKPIDIDDLLRTIDGFVG
jgi:CheY-like chemotaxis protein